MPIKKDLIDQLLKDYKKPEDVIGENGLLKQLTKAILDRAMNAELTITLGMKKTTLPATTAGPHATVRPQRR